MLRRVLGLESDTWLLRPWAGGVGVPCAARWGANAGMKTFFSPWAWLQGRFGFAG